MRSYKKSLKDRYINGTLGPKWPLPPKRYGDPVDYAYDDEEEPQRDKIVLEPTIPIRIGNFFKGILLTLFGNDQNQNTKKEK